MRVATPSTLSLDHLSLHIVVDISGKTSDALKDLTGLAAESVFISDVPRHSLESSAHNNKRKDSNNSISSVKEPDIPEPKNDMYSVLSKDKVGCLNLAYSPNSLSTLHHARVLQARVCVRMKKVIEGFRAKRA